LPSMAAPFVAALLSIAMAAHPMAGAQGGLRGGSTRAAPPVVVVSSQGEGGESQPVTEEPAEASDPREEPGRPNRSSDACPVDEPRSRYRLRLDDSLAPELSKDIESELRFVLDDYCPTSIVEVEVVKTGADIYRVQTWLEGCGKRSDRVRKICEACTSEELAVGIVRTVDELIDGRESCFEPEDAASYPIRYPEGNPIGYQRSNDPEVMSRIRSGIRRTAIGASLYGAGFSSVVAGGTWFGISGRHEPGPQRSASITFMTVGSALFVAGAILLATGLMRLHVDDSVREGRRRPPRSGRWARRRG
jgi:hypothetical protein